MAMKWCFPKKRKKKNGTHSFLNYSRSHFRFMSLRITRISRTMSSMSIYPMILCVLVSHSIAHDMHSLKMSIMKGQLFQCANTTCPPSVSLTVSKVRNCQIACLNEDSCQAASFQRSTSSCDLFAYVPHLNESISTNVEMVAMIVISGTRAPLGEYDF